MKKLIGLMALASAALMTACEEKKADNNVDNDIKTEEIINYKNDLGYAGLNKKMPDFSIYENTTSYRTVSNYKELLDAIKDAKGHYNTNITDVIGNKYVKRANLTNEKNWINAINTGLYKYENGSFNKIEANTPFPGADKTTTGYYEKSPYLEAKYTQTPQDGYTEDNFLGTVRVIEILNDIDLGWKYVPAEYKPADDFASNSFVENFSRKNKTQLQNLTMSSMYNEAGGISQLKIENTSNLLIYSKTGAKLTHGGFSVLSCDNVAFRNISMDEMWQWEDVSEANISKAGVMGDYDSFGWAYFKISHSGNVWIDHCEFGKSFDGLIDVSNPNYTSKQNAFRAPYGADGTSAVHISNCSFNSGSREQTGFIYKMMEEIEADYQNGNKNYMYYNALRKAGYTFDQILDGIARPQKKGFLLGDTRNEYKYNLQGRVSFSNCKFINIEDRIPNVRGGICYMYNCIVEATESFAACEVLKKGINQIPPADQVVKTVKSSWKCALTSQGVLCANGGDVYAKNVIFKGIKALIKNNISSDPTNNAEYPNATNNGGIKMENCSYQATIDSEVITDFSQFPNETPTILNESFFDFKTENNENPFNIETIELDSLAELLKNIGLTQSVNMLEI